MVTSKRMAVMLLLVFAGLVGAGVTGSSLPLNLGQDGLIRSDAAVLLGKNRVIRSDEWLVITRMAIAQASHQPRFPVVNTHLGPDGQNMLVVGMVGVPVAHVSAIAKPATWGFFVFDLRRALAWYWWLPPFACLFALWGVMRILAPGCWRLGLATAAIFVSSAYVVAWSNWPAYAVLFPAAAFWSFFSLFETTSRLRLVALAVGLGVALAGFVFVLYPPWQVSVGYLFLVLAAVVGLRGRIWLRLNAPRTIAIAGAAAVFVLLFGAWWEAAESAIDAMQATIYPGRRTTEAGGDMFWFLSFRGFLNHYTLDNEVGLLNQSESASFVSLFPVVIAAALIQVRRRIRPSACEIALMVFCIAVLWFQHVGIGKWLAEMSLLGRVIPIRADLALGLASVLLCSLWLASSSHSHPLTQRESMAISGLFALAAGAGALHIPEIAIGKPGIWVWAALLPALFALSYWLLTKNTRAYVAGLLAINFGMTLVFNPLVRAPSEIAPSEALLSAIGDKGRRILVVGSLSGPMGLLAAGVPVANGVFYYPQPSLWQSLDPKGLARSRWNRYQHLLYEPEAAGGSGDYRIEQTEADVVRIRFDPDRFFFSLGHADFVLAPASVDLSRNPSLGQASVHGGSRLYAVKAGPPL